jgi:hypothetical protein
MNGHVPLQDVRPGERLEAYRALQVLPDRSAAQLLHTALLNHWEHLHPWQCLGTWVVSVHPTVRPSDVRFL